MGWRLSHYALVIIALTLLVILGWEIIRDGFPGPIKDDPEGTMAQWHEYERLAKEYPAK